MEFLSDLIWFSLLSEYLIKSTLVLSLAIFLAYFCRKQPASLRHFILSISLIGLLVFPILSTVYSGWETELLPSLTRETKSSSTMNVAVITQNAKSESIKMDNSREESQNYGTRNAIQSTWPGITSTSLWNFLKYSLLVIWFSGVLFVLVRQIFGLFGAYNLTKEADDLKSSFWRHLLYRFLKVASIKKKVNLYQHKKVKVPLTWGWIKPVVIMPDESKLWTAEQQESALYHELSHVKRGDFLAIMLARISLGFYWFNPLTWLVYQLMKKEQEKACDELVLKTGIKPSTYAANLLSIRKSMQMSWNPPAAVLGAMGKSQLNDRLLTILKQKFRLKEVKLRTKIFFTVLVILTITFLGTARPSSSNNNPEISNVGDVFLSEGTNPVIKDQEDQKKKKDQEKTDKKENKEKNKDVFVWHMDEGEEGEVEVIITENGKTIDIKKDEEGTWVIKEDALSLHEHMEAIDLGEGSVITLKTRTKDGHKTIEIKAPAVVVKKIEHPSEHITVEVSEEGGKKKAVVVAPCAHVELHPDIHLQVKETELKKIHEKLQKIHEQLSKKMESKTEEEELALKEMEETLKKLKKKLETKN